MYASFLEESIESAPRIACKLGTVAIIVQEPVLFLFYFSLLGGQEVQLCTTCYSTTAIYISLRYVDSPMDTAGDDMLIDR